MTQAHNFKPPASDQPRVWLLLGHKAGDNEQVCALAEALSWHYQVKRFVYRRYELLTNRLLGATLAGVIKKKSSPLAPPWPDLVITAGRRNDPIAQWIRKQAGGRTRIVRLGRPWAPVEDFDLVVITPQYLLPPHPKLVKTTFPLHRIHPTRLQEAAKCWAPRLAHLPRPYVAVLAGGNSGAYTFRAQHASYLGERANELAAADGGSVLLTTSARTPKSASQALLEVVKRRPAYVYEWHQKNSDNPYLAYLALADLFIVTGESISMLTEACATGKPVYILDLDPNAKTVPEDVIRIPWRERWRQFRIQPLIHRLAMRVGPRHLRRDIRAIHRVLCESGRAAYVNADLSIRPPSPAADDLKTAVNRVKALF